MIKYKIGTEVYNNVFIIIEYGRLQFVLSHISNRSILEMEIKCLLNEFCLL